MLEVGHYGPTTTTSGRNGIGIEKYVVAISRKRRQMVTSKHKEKILGCLSFDNSTCYFLGPSDNSSCT